MNDFFQEIKKREEKRLTKAIKEARETVFKNRFPCLHDLSLKEVIDYEKLLERLESLLLMGSEEFLKHLSSPLEEIRGRSRWEVYLSGLRYLTRRYPRGFFRKTILHLKEWKEFPEKVDAYSDKSLGGFSDFADLAAEIKKYSAHYNKAKAIVGQYKDDRTDDENDLCRLYASLKSWEKEEDISRFNNDLEKSRVQFFEVIIEGPIQLYLLIGEETWFLVLKILTVERLGDFFFDKDKRELQDLGDIHKFVYETIKSSELYKTFKEFIGEALRIYVVDLQKSERKLRNQYPTEDLKRKFIKRFESGEIFK